MLIPEPCIDAKTMRQSRCISTQASRVRRARGMPRAGPRRQFLAVAGVVGLPGALSACASPVLNSITGGQPNTADVIYWNLFGGGDGINMAKMVSSFQQASHLSVGSSLLCWGNPYD